MIRWSIRQGGFDGSLLARSSLLTAHFCALAAVGATFTTFFGNETTAKGGNAKSQSVRHYLKICYRSFGGLWSGTVYLTEGHLPGLKATATTLLLLYDYLLWGTLCVLHAALWITTILLLWWWRAAVLLLLGIATSIATSDGQYELHLCTIIHGRYATSNSASS